MNTTSHVPSLMPSEFEDQIWREFQREPTGSNPFDEELEKYGPDPVMPGDPITCDGCDDYVEAADTEQDDAGNVLCPACRCRHEERKATAAHTS